MKESKNDVLKALEVFQSKLNQEPNPNEVQVNKHAGNSNYLPISFVETTLDELYFGLYETKDYRHDVINGQVVGSIQLGVFHPVAEIWIWRTGAASVFIQGGKNSLTKDYPHLKIECLKNAAKSLGKIFGRDLNRKLEDTYVPAVTAEENARDIERVEKRKEKERLLKFIASADSIDKLLTVSAFVDRYKVQKEYDAKFSQLNPVTKEETKA